MSSPRPIFRMFNPNKKSKEEAAEQRREQLRRAQNTYRLRKTRYIKDLEGSLSRSQQREHRLSTEVERLQAICRQHGVPTDPNSTMTLLPSPPPTSSQGGFPSLATRACDVDQATLGMTFVLKIEEPCLGHIHGDPKRPDDPSGHAMTATSHLLCLQQDRARQNAQRASPGLPPAQGDSRWTRSFRHSPTSATAASSFSSSPSSSWPSPLLLATTADGSTQPGAILERLLALAPEVVPPSSSSSKGDNESGEGVGITPIQAWNEIQRRPVLGSLDLRCIMGLAEKLRDAARCHGFGAVVDYTIFQQLVVEFMTAKISFNTP
ncbi:AP-1-like transcription factor [Microdochium nivale]|nr:AP-1-like transcription factor [Microdochium nivale]